MRASEEARGLFEKAVEELREGFLCPGCEKWLSEEVGARLLVLDWKVQVVCPYCKERWVLSFGTFEGKKENPQLVARDS